MRKICRFFLLIVVLTTAACAPTSPWNGVTVPPRAPNPAVPSGHLKDCTPFYPVGEKGRHGTLYTTLAVHIAADGTLSDASIVRSQGGPAFDEAALDCTRVAYFVPPTINGAPVAVDWNIDIRWSAEVPSYVTPTYIAGPSCQSFYPPLSIRLHETGYTAIEYTVDTQGNAVNPFILESMGNQMLNDAALQCLATWRFTVAKQNGVPVAIRRRATILWTLP